MSQEEAIQPMKKEVLFAVPKVVKMIEENIKNSKGKIVVVGVGNTAGVGNNAKDAQKAEKLILHVLKIMEKRKEEEKESKWSWFTGW
jgi:hypothetical protein